MKFFRLDLLTLLISLFILNSCKNPDGVGLDVDEKNQLSGTLMVDSNVVLNTVTEDSVVVSGLTRVPLALFNDPVFGLTESNIATDINLPNLAKYTIPEGTITIDSAIMQLKYTPKGFYGDSLNSVYKINVFQLRERPLQSVTYFGSKIWDYNKDVVVGTKTFIARPNDTLRIKAIVKGGVDTVTRVVPQLRVPINPVFINELLFTSQTHVESNPIFQNNAKGLYITLDKEGTTGTGGIMGFNTPDSVHIYIRVANGTTVDTSIVSLPITRHVAQIKHTHSATINAVLENPSETSNDRAYIQGMGGLRVKVNFPDLSKLKNVIINRAELVLTPVLTNQYAPLPRLMMYKLDLAKQRTPIEDAADTRTGFASVFGGFYGVPIKNEYRFLVTSYIQNLVAGKTTDYGTYIGAANDAAVTSTDISALAYPIQRTILAGKNSNFRVKLNVIYTNIK